MNQLTSLFAAVICTSISFGSFSQTNTENTDCSSTRWISVKNSEKNAALFAALPEIFEEVKRQNDLQLLYATRESQEVGPLTDENGKPIIQVSEDGEKTFVYQSETIRINQQDIPLIDKNGDPIIITMDDGKESFVYEPFLITDLHKEGRLVDENGDPVIETLGDGTRMYAYPDQVNFKVQPQIHAIDEKGNLVPFPSGDPMNYCISELAISELRVVESKSYDSETGKYSDEFHVSRIAFCMNSSATYQEQLWVDLLSFFENMENPEQNPFYVLLTERAYKGFEYKQTPCK